MKSSLDTVLKRRRLQASPFGLEAESVRATLQGIAEDAVMAHLPQLMAEMRKRILDDARVHVQQRIPLLKGEKGDSIVGPKGDKGDKGDKPTVGVDFPFPKDGKDSVVPGPQGPQGIPGKDGSPDTPEQIAEKLNTLSEAVDFSVIKGLKGILERFQRLLKEKKGGASGGGMGNFTTDNFTGDGVTTAFTLTNNVASGGRAALALLQGQVQEYTTHYTISGKTLTFTTAPENGMAIHVWYIRK